MNIQLIEMTDKEIIETTTHSSKGNQLKWQLNDKWIKADYLGYEGLSEFIVSNLLKKTNVQNFTQYHLEQIKYKKNIYTGCSSENFLQKDESILTLEKLFRMYYGIEISEKCAKIEDIKEKIKYTVDRVIEVTGLQDFGKYLTTLLEVDAIFLDEDRHFNNIAVIYNENNNTFNYCPIFDNGAALLSDTVMDYPLGEDVYNYIDQVQAKPFSTNFEEQMDAAESLYGVQLRYWIENRDIEYLIDEIRESHLYPDEIINRVETCTKEQVHKYVYMKTAPPKQEQKHFIPMESKNISYQPIIAQEDIDKNQHAEQWLDR